MEDKNKQLMIRNSTIEVRVQDENLWLTQKLIASPFEVSIHTINEYLKNIISSDELEESSVVGNLLITVEDVWNYQTKH